MSDDGERISWSAFRALTACEQRWWLQHVERVSQTPNAAAARGLAVHEVLAGEDVERVAAETGVAREDLSARAEAAARFLDGHEVLGVELDLSMPLGPGKLTGRLDVLSRAPDGRLVVTDWKTGKSAADDQLVVYALLVHHAFGRWPALRSVMIDHEVEVPRPYRASEVAQLRAQLVAALVQMSRVRERGPRARTGRQCDWCFVRTACPAWKGENDGPAPVG